VTRQVRLTLLPAQADFIGDLGNRVVALVGGYGGGKTRAGILWLIDRGARNWPCAGLYVAPTYPMVRDIAVRTFREVFEETGIPYNWHRSDNVITFRRKGREHEIYMRSGDKPERLVGFNAGHALLDEPGQMDAEVYDRTIARVRDPRAKVRQIGLTGTPEGFNWLHEVLVEKPAPGTVNGSARTFDNPFLPKEYADTLLARYPEALVRQYLGGEFVRLEGSVYQFQRDVHVKPCERAFGPGAQVLVGADFNVSKMAWVFARKLGDELHIFDELIIEDTNTWETTEEAARRLIGRWGQDMAGGMMNYANRQAMLREITVHPDASGASRRTSATDSDHAILRQAGFNVVSSRANAHIKDRVASVNDRLRARRLFVDPRCTETIRVLEQRGYTKDGKPEKNDANPKADLSHCADALEYVVHQHWPITGLRGNANTWRRH
jgi:phage terminase large subunit